VIKKKPGGASARECPAEVSVSNRKMPDDRARGTVGPGGGGGGERMAVSVAKQTVPSQCDCGIGSRGVGAIGPHHPTSLGL